MIDTLICAFAIAYYVCHRVYWLVVFGICAIVHLILGDDHASLPSRRKLRAKTRR